MRRRLPLQLTVAALVVEHTPQRVGQVVLQPCSALSAVRATSIGWQVVEVPSALAVRVRVRCTLGRSTMIWNWAKLALWIRRLW